MCIIKKTKKVVVSVLLAMSIIALVTKTNASKQMQYYDNITEEFIEYVNTTQVEYIETVYLSWDSCLYAGLPQEDDNRILPLIMRWENPAGYLRHLVNALKTFPYKERASDKSVHFTVRFFTKSSKEIFRVSLARNFPAVIINGKAYEVTPEIIKSLKYFMPFLAYDQISHSIEYEDYFKESTKTDPNSINK